MANPLSVFRQKKKSSSLQTSPPENKNDIKRADTDLKRQSFNKIVMYCAFIPLFFLVLILSLHSILPKEKVPELVFDSKLLIFALNLIFVLLSSFVIAYLAGRTYLKTGWLSLLLLGAGALMVGLTNATSSFLVGPGNINYVITVHNSGMLIAAVFHFGGTVFALSEIQIGEKFRKLYLSGTYGFMILSIILFCLFSQKVLSPFYIDAIGFTPLRQMVLGSAVLLFAVSGFNLFGIYHRTKSVFSGFYAIALMLFATGLLGVFLQRIMGDPIGWAGRSAQCLGGVFFFIAVLEAYKTASLQQSHLDKVLSESLSQVRDLYKSLIDTISDAVIVIDDENRILLWNSAAETMFGYTINETSGRLIQTLGIISDDISLFTEKGFLSDSKKGFEFTAKRRNGDIFSAEASVSKPMILSRIGFTFIIRDITERKQSEEALRESEERLRIALESAQLGTFDFDIKRQVLGWDEQTKRMCGIAGGEDPNYEEAVRFIHPDDRLGLEEILTRSFHPTADGNYQAVFRIVRPDGSVIWNQAMGKVYFEGEGPERKAVRQIGVNKDITERKKAEEELQKAHQRLEERVRERTAELEAESERRRYLAKRLVDVLEEDRRNLSVMLHDDLGQIIAGSKMQIENFKNDLTEIDPELPAKIDPILESLQGIMSSLRSRSRELRPNSLDILGLAATLRSIGSGDSKCRIRYHVPEEPEGGHPDLKLTIFRIAQEAVINALKHADCSEIHLSLVRRDEVLTLMVEDNGRGFSYEEITANGKGRGPMGLLIMRERAVNAGGKFRVESSPGKGTTAMAEFPLEVEPVSSEGTN